MSADLKHGLFILVAGVIGVALIVTLDKKIGNTNGTLASNVGGLAGAVSTSIFA